MKIKPLFEQSEIGSISIEKLLEKYGIGDVEEYIKGNTIEPTTNYDNIDEWCELVNNYMKEGGQNINQE